MRLTTRGRYAVTALVDLAVHSKGKPVCLAEIAARQGLSLSYLEQLFCKLRRQGLVRSVRGPGGGYVLGRDAGGICIADIVVTVEGSLQRPAQGRSQRKRTASCCPSIELWQALGQRVEAFLGSVSLDDVIEGRLAPAGGVAHQAAD